MMHVIVPFSRPQNLNAFVDHMRKQNIILHPIFEADRSYNFPAEPWIQPFLATPPHTYRNCVYGEVLNEFIDRGNLEDETYYHLFSDDCFVEDGYYDKIGNA